MPRDYIPTPHERRHELIIWDLLTGERQHTRELAGNGVASVLISPDGNFAVSGGVSVSVWCVATGDEVHCLAHGGPCTALGLLLAPPPHPNIVKGGDGGGGAKSSLGMRASVEPVVDLPGSRLSESAVRSQLSWRMAGAKVGAGGGVVRRGEGLTPKCIVGNGCYRPGPRPL